MTDSAEFHIIAPRSTVEIHLPDGKVMCGPRGASIEDFFKNLCNGSSVDSAHGPIVGAVINGDLRELTYPVQMDSRVRPVTMDQSDGKLIYRRSLTFLLDTAFEELFPDAVLTIDHSVASGGYYCEVSQRPPLNDQEIKKLEARMRELVEADLPFTKEEVPLAEAIDTFKNENFPEKVRLLAHRQKDYLTLYSLGSHKDYHHGYMVPSTGYLKWFGFLQTNGGFTLRFPRSHAPTRLSPLPEYPKLLATFREYGDWLIRLGIDSVGALNDAIQEGRIREIILVSEALHEQRLAQIASSIASRKDEVRIVLIAGPSSSGKTTLSKRLSIQLLAQGISPFPLEIDNYFLDREKTPRNKDGELDFESINALNRERLASDLRSLIAGKPTRLPHYNFRLGVSEEGETIQIHPNQVMILEGIHGLNPELIPGISHAQTFRIYVSALTQLNLDRHNRISTTDTRLVRRIVRDARERGYTARDTIQRWDSVRRGEKVNIFPYQENADVLFNSALVYELAALKPMAEPLLRQVPHGTDEFIEAKRLLALLEWFLPLTSETIPDNSILREFIGGSILQEFKLWNYS